MNEPVQKYTVARFSCIYVESGKILTFALGASGS